MSLREKASTFNMGLRQKANHIIQKQKKIENKIDIVKQSSGQFPIQLHDEIEKVLNICVRQLSARELMLFLAKPDEKENKAFKLLGQRGYDDLLEEESFVVYEDDILVQIMNEEMAASGNLFVDLSAYLDHPVIGVHLKILWEHFIEIGVPFYYKQELIGILLIGRRFDKEPLDSVDRDFLEFISHFWGLYLTNAYQCQECYQSLTQKVG